MTMPLKQRVLKEFQEGFGDKPRALVRGPGRVNLIGEHTDYNDGFVLPMALDMAVWAALRPRKDRCVVLRSLDFDQECSFSLDDLAKGEPGWVEYVKGVAWAMEQDHSLQGMEGVLAGDVPIGASLSSSAALEIAMVTAFAHFAELDLDPGQAARLGQTAENQWVGMRCGIMDQMISAAGRAGHAMLLDCRTLEREMAPLPRDCRVVVMDTTTRRKLVESAYNERRQQCEAGAQFFGKPALRDVSLEEFEAREKDMEPLVRKRVRHIVTENQRTLDAAQALRGGDSKAFGKLMDASHESMRRDFEISSPALDSMVKCAQSAPGCLGARMTGGGFAGCAVALVRADDAEIFVEKTAQCYEQETGLAPAMYVCEAAQGASVMTPGRDF